MNTQRRYFDNGEVGKKKHTERFDPADVEPLLEKAKAGDVFARDELIYRFHRVIASLVEVCVTAKINPRSSRQIKLLKLFGRPTTPIQNTAHKLKSLLKDINPKELFHIGQLAAIEAIDRSNTNYATTIVICFKELIDEIIKDGTTIYLEDAVLFNKPGKDDFIEADFQMFLDSLSEEDWLIADKIINGEKVNINDIPESLKVRIRIYVKEQDQI